MVMNSRRTLTNQLRYLADRETLLAHGINIHFFISSMNNALPLTERALDCFHSTRIMTGVLILVNHQIE